MRTKKRIRLSFQPSDKNLIYLERLGLMDGRTGGKKSSANFSALMNECLTITLESKMNPMASVADSEELLRAYMKMQIAARNREIERLQTEIEAIVQKRREMVQDAVDVVGSR